MSNQKFHIAEWYGRPFQRMSEQERVQLAGHKVGGAVMSKADVTRLVHLDEKAAAGRLSKTESERLLALRSMLDRQWSEELPCPFRSDTPYAACTKPGGVCSIRLYGDDDGRIEPVEGDLGQLRTLCPWRFHQDHSVFREIGARLLDDPDPLMVGEVGFLESVATLDSEAGEDVGRIDMILVKSNGVPSAPMDWVAVEVQAVYFSGKKMSIEFKHIEKESGRFSMPRENRRPDYRSSGVKRLMPQLKIKINTLRAWGKKMVVVVDVPFYQSMGKMEREKDVSNAEIIWFLVNFVECPAKEMFHPVIDDVIFTTLDDAERGLMAATKVSQRVFEDRIRRKIEGMPSSTREPRRTGARNGDSSNGRKT